MELDYVWRGATPFSNEAFTTASCVVEHADHGPEKQAWQDETIWHLDVL